MKNVSINLKTLEKVKDDIMDMVHETREIRNDLIIREKRNKW